SAEVSNLTIENRKPKAIIVSPKNGWVGNTETKWILQGYGSDIEDGTIPTGEWTIDGIKTEETEVVLSSGTHTLTFKVTDSGGLTDETSVEVEVKETMENIDLSLNEKCLTLLIPGRDPLNTAPVIWLEKDGVHRAILKIQNVGIETNFIASLYLKGPSDTEETLLTSKVFTPEAFEEVVLSETFIAEEGGEYTIRGKIEIPEDAILQDENISNNEWTWKYRTQPEEPIIDVLPEELNFGDVRGRKEGFILIKNYGNANLEITSLTITGSSEFSITSSVPNIPADNSILVPVYFDPKSTGEKEATLTITSNDKEVSITLKGNCISMPLTKGDISGNGETDISDVILCLRIAIELPVTIEGTQYPYPYEDWIKERADINGDKEVDIKDVIKVLRIAIELEKMKASRK
ncbi:MAG TPA: choice-of-anchor D domain-containing protein, partial [Candidatus Ratteibacteria bacterium]|nr:choice-of-anchor D domain-containing protein [Candidatus Ratteibacteria bacterium]